MLSNLFMQVLSLSLSGALITALILVLRFVLKKAPRWIVCALWALVAVRLLVPSLPRSTVSVVPQAVSEGTIVREISERPVEPTVRIPEAEPEFAALQISQPEVPVRQDTQSGMRYIEVSAATHEAPKTFHDTVLPVLSVIWLVGIGLMLLYMAFSTLRIRRRVKNSSVRERDNLWICDSIGSPFILGVLRPRVYLPYSLKEPEKSYVLAHEQAHIRRLDHCWKPLGFILLSVYWFNPVLWVAYILLCRDIELACDEKVIGRQEDDYKKAYSEALLRCSAKQRLITACPLAFGEVGVKARIRSVLNYKKPALWILITALLASLIAAGCALTNRGESGDAPEENSTAEEPTAQTEEDPYWETAESPTQAGYTSLSPYDYYAYAFPAVVPEGVAIPEEQLGMPEVSEGSDIVVVCRRLSSDPSNPLGEVVGFRYFLSSDDTANPEPDRIKVLLNGGIVFPQNTAICPAVERLDEFAYLYETLVRRSWIPLTEAVETGIPVAWFSLEGPDGQEDLFVLFDNGALYHTTGSLPEEPLGWEGTFDTAVEEPLSNEAWMHLVAIGIRNMQGGPPMALVRPSDENRREDFWQARIEADRQDWILSGEAALPLYAVFDDPMRGTENTADWMTEYDEAELLRGALKITVINAAQESFEEPPANRVFYLTPEGRILRFASGYGVSYTGGTGTYLGAYTHFAIISRRADWQDLYETLKQGPQAAPEEPVKTIPLSNDHVQRGSDSAYEIRLLPVQVDGKALYTEADGICDFCVIGARALYGTTLLLLDHLNKRVILQRGEEDPLQVLDISFCEDPVRISGDNGNAVVLDTKGVYILSLDAARTAENGSASGASAAGTSGKAGGLEPIFVALPDGITAEQIEDIRVYPLSSGGKILLTTDLSVPYNLSVPYAVGAPGAAQFEPTQDGCHNQLSEYGKWEVRADNTVWKTGRSSVTGEILAASVSQKSLTLCERMNGHALIRSWYDWREAPMAAVQCHESRVDLSDFVRVPEHFARENTLGGAIWVIAPRSDGLHVYYVNVGWSIIEGGK